MTMLVKVSLVHLYSGVTVENTFGLAVPDASDLQLLASDIATVLTGSAWMSGRSDQMSLVKVRAEDDTPATQGSGEFLLPVPETGDDAGNGSPQLCALVVKWRGTGRGKAGRGRMYLGGYPASTAIAGFWTSDAQDPASAAASVIFDAFGPDGTGTLAIINRFAGGVELAPHVSNPITSFTVDNVIRRQGRREVDRGI